MKKLFIFLFLGMFLISLASSSITDGLVSYYPFNEDSGTSTKDFYGNYNLTASGTNVLSTCSTGLNGRCANLSSGGYLSGLFSNWSANESTTISLWFRGNLNAWTGNILNISDISGNGIEQKGFSSSVKNIIYYNTESLYSSYYYPASGNPPTIGQWYNLILMINFTGDKRVYSYVNGVEYKSAVVINTRNAGVNPLLTLGSYNGDIDEVIYWNRTLNSSEIAQVYNGGNGIYINTLPPQITLNYPTALIDYGAINGTLQLNFTATDTNLDKVWYNYNGTNVTIAGATSGVANLSNITLSSKKNITIYANDTAGNLNTTLFSWDYKVFENSQSYINQTYAQVSNPFIVNITSQNISSFKLNYNGTNYSANTFTSGSNTIGTVNILAPIVSADTNISFYWIYTLLDGSTINSDTKIQTIKYIVLGNNYSNLIYNITVKDEFTNTFIPNSNVTMTYEVTYGFTNTSILATKLNFYDFNYSNKNISSNIFTSLYMTGNIIYSAPNYIGRNYYFLENYINSSKNITLYLTGDNISYVKAITVTDEAGRGQSATFKQYRVIGGVKTLVASETLGSTGKSTITFIPNVQYTFEFTKSGCDDLTNNIIFYDQSEYIQALSCTAYNPDDYIDPFEGMVATFSPNGVFNVNNATNTSASLFSVNISGTSSFCDSVSVVSFNVYNQLGNMIVNDNGNSCDVLFGSGLFNNFATGSVYILLDSGEEKTLTFKWIKLYSDSDYANYSILTLLGEVGNSDDILGIDWKFKILISFIGLLGIIIALTIYQRIYNFSNLPILIVADIYIWFMCFLGWGDLNIGASSGGITALVSKYALLILAVIASAGIIATKEDEYS